MALLGPAGRGGASGEPPLVLETSLPLLGVAGRIDHMAVDVARGRLLVAELGNETVDVLDLASGRPLHRLSGLSSPQGVAYLPRSDLVAVADGGDGVVRFYRADDLSPAGSLRIGEDADNLRVDTGTGQLWVGFG